MIQLRRRIYKGVPDRWRMAAWWTLAEDAVARGTDPGARGKRAELLEADYRVCLASYLSLCLVVASKDTRPLHIAHRSDSTDRSAGNMILG